MTSHSVRCAGLVLHPTVYMALMGKELQATPMRMHTLALGTILQECRSYFSELSMSNNNLWSNT